MVGEKERRRLKWGDGGMGFKSRIESDLPVHVPYHEFLDVVGGIPLPAGFEDGGPAAARVVQYIISDVQ